MVSSLDKNKVRVRVRFYGIVQGVYFRANTRRKASTLGLFGYVRNMSDGSVEALFEGENKKVSEVIEWCKNNIPSAVVTKTELQYEDPKNDYTSFVIRYD